MMDKPKVITIRISKMNTTFQIKNAAAFWEVIRKLHTWVIIKRYTLSWLQEDINLT